MLINSTVLGSAGRCAGPTPPALDEPTATPGSPRKGPRAACPEHVILRSGGRDSALCGHQEEAGLLSRRWKVLLEVSQQHAVFIFIASGSLSPGPRSSGAPNTKQPPTHGAASRAVPDWTEIVLRRGPCPVDPNPHHTLSAWGQSGLCPGFV